MNAIEEIIDEAEKTENKKREASEKNWWRTIKKIAAGQKPAMTEIDALLSQSGKSLENLREAVAAYQRRIDNVAAIAEAEKTSAEIPGLEKTIAHAEGEMQKTVDKFAATIGQARDRLNEISAMQHRAEIARQSLANQNPYPHLNAEMAEISRKLAVVQTRRNALSVAIVDVATRNVGATNESPECAAKVAAMQKEIEPLDAEVDALKKQEAKVIGKMMEP